MLNSNLFICPNNLGEIVLFLLETRRSDRMNGLWRSKRVCWCEHGRRLWCPKADTPSVMSGAGGGGTLPVTVAVQAHRCRTASSPNTFPPLMLLRFLPCLVTSTLPSADTHRFVRRLSASRTAALKRQEKEKHPMMKSWDKTMKILLLNICTNKKTSYFDSSTRFSF